MIATEMATGVAVADGVKIVFHSAGKGGPPVVFLHGIFCDHGYFDAQVAHLAPRRRVVTMDFRAHGESDRPDTVTVEAFARDVEAVLDAAGIERAVLCGHSMAGGVALDIAARRPSAVAGVVMLDGVIFFPELVRRGAMDGLVPALGGDQWSEALREYFGRLIDPASPQVTEKVIGDVGRGRREVAASFFASVFGAAYPARQQRYEDALAHLRCPLMYVRGKSPADLQRLVAHKPDAIIEQVVDSGHYVMLSAAEQVNAMLDRFLVAVDQAESHEIAAPREGGQRP